MKNTIKNDWIPLEISHKGQLHKLHKMLQEETVIPIEPTQGGV